MEHFLSTYGYVAIIMGTFFEGETILILGGFIARHGYLKLPVVILSAFMGSLIGDQLFFFIGRIKGKPMLQRRPKLQAKAEKVFGLLERYDSLLMVGFRFLYGLRTVTPFVLGVSNVSVIKFVALNIVGASLWAVCIGTLGYFFGNAVEVVLGDIKRYEMGLLFGLVFVAAGVMVIRYCLRRKINRPPEVKS